MADFVTTPEPDEPDFAYYTGIGGQLTEAAFKSFFGAAVAKVDKAIWPNQVTSATQDAYRRCICAVVEALNDPAVKREGAGKISVEYAEAQTVDGIIRERLAGTGLLYAGL